MPRAAHSVLIACLAVLPAALALETAAARDQAWEFSPAVSVSQIYTDNVELAPAGEEDHEWVTELDAGFSLSREGSRASARLSYNFQGLEFWRESDRSDVFHQFSGDGNVDLVPELLFVEAFTAFRQRPISQDAGFGDNINITDNRTDEFLLRVSPVLVQRWGDTASGQLRYVHNRVYFRDAEVRDDSSYSNEIRARLESGPEFTRVGWELAYDWSDTQFDDGSSATLRRAEALARWFATAGTSLFAVVGQEDNDFTQDPRRAEPDGTLWLVGATYEPDARLFAEAFFGERFFGRTYGGNLEYRFRDAVAFVNYTEDLETVNSFDLTPERVPVVDETGRPVLEEGRPVVREFETPDIQTGVFLSKRLTAGIAGERRRLGWSARLYQDRREFELDDRTERVRGIRGSTTWRLRPRTRVFGDASIEERNFPDRVDRDDLRYTVELGVIRDVGPRTTASLAYLYRERDSDEDGNDYRENRLTATVSMRF